MIVVSLCRPLESQVVFWMDFLMTHIDVTTTVILVGSKSDAVKPKKKLAMQIGELEMLANKYNLHPIILSSHNLTNVSALKKEISTKAKEILESSNREVPTSYLSFLESLHLSKDLVVESVFSEEILSFFHNIGEIIFDKNSGFFFLSDFGTFFSLLIIMNCCRAGVFKSRTACKINGNVHLS